MATEKKLDVRFQLRTGTKADWDNTTAAGLGGNLVLKTGEAGVYVVPKDTATGQEAATMLKIGYNNTAFKDLPWLSALAADVYPWAKEPSIAVESDLSDGNVITSITWDGSGNDGKGRIYYTKGITALTSHQPIKVLDTKTYTKDSSTSLTPLDNEEIAGSGKIYLHKVSKTGKYEDLSGKPDINDGQLSIKLNGEPLEKRFTANQAGNTEFEITDTNYQLTKDGTKLNLQSKTSGSFTTVSGQTFDLADMLKSTFVNKTGDTITGPIHLDPEIFIPTDDDELVCKRYVITTVNQAVSDAITGVAKFFGTFGSDTEFNSIIGNVDSKGDFARCTTGFDSQVLGSTLHAGDLVVCTVYPVVSPIGACFSVVHGETYTMNSATADGYVAKGQGNANKVWKTDASGNPGWRVDDNTSHFHAAGFGLLYTGSSGGTGGGTTTYKLNLVSETLATKEASGVEGTLLQPVSLDMSKHLSVKIPDVGLCIVIHDDTVHGAMTATVPAGQIPKIHFPQATGLNEPETGALRVTFNEIVEKTLDKADTWTVDDNHVPTTKAIDAAIKTHGGIDKTGTVTSVSAGVGLKVTGTTPTVNPKIEFDDSVVFVLNGGTATTVI